MSKQMQHMRNGCTCTYVNEQKKKKKKKDPKDTCLFNVDMHKYEQTNATHA